MVLTSKYDNANFLVRGKDFKKFWKDYLVDRRQIIYIMGLGFDPRALNCFLEIQKHTTPERMDCKIITYDEKSSLNPRLQSVLEHNTELLASVVPESKWNSKTISTTTADTNVSLAASRCIRSSELNGYTDIIMDVSAMPTTVYFPIVRNILDWISKQKIQTSNGKLINLHMVVSENPKLDSAIKDVNISGTITYMHKFATRLQSVANQELPVVWIPLLGEGRKTHLDKIYSQMNGIEESCPFFPIPSVDPYRCKKLLMEHRQLLKDRLGTSSKDYVYASEMNPFDVCRKIYSTAQRYYDLFKPLGGCKIAISPLSSKLMCIGALLASCELLAKKSEAGVVHVTGCGYDVDDIDLDIESQRSVPHSMWLEGECYA